MNQQHDFAKAHLLLESFLQATAYADLLQAGSRMGEAGEFDLAVATFERATQLEPDRYDGKFDLAFAFFRSGRYTQAEKSLDRIPAAQSQSQSDYHYFRGKTELALQHPQMAREEYAKALHLQTGNESLCIDAGLLDSKFE